MSDTTTERSPAIRHPQSVLDDAVALVDKIEIPENLQDIVEFVARTVLPPPNVWALLRAADVVRTHVRDRRAEAEGLISFLKNSRYQAHQVLRGGVSGVLCDSEDRQNRKSGRHSHYSNESVFWALVNILYV